jgi:hypothetical protein
MDCPYPRENYKLFNPHSLDTLDSLDRRLLLFETLLEREVFGSVHTNHSQIIIIT